MPTINRKILLGLTTFEGSDWEDKVNEINQFNIKEIALLPNFLNLEERKELYRMLESTPLESIPHVNLSYDAEQWELDYLMQKYKTKVFACGADKGGYQLITRLPKYNTMIYMENGDSVKSNKFFNEKLFDKYQVNGISLDLAHLENEKAISKSSYNKTVAMLGKYSVGCSQIRGVNVSKLNGLFKKPVYNYHLKSLDQLDYLKDKPKEYFSSFIVMELSNSFMEQLEIQKHLEDMLN